MTAIVAVDRHRVCCGLLHVKTATWIIAIFHLIMVGYILLIGIIDIIKDTHEHRRYAGHTNFGGIFGQGALLVFTVLWFIAILLLIYGLYKNRATFILVHLIFMVVYCVALLIRAVQAIVNGDELVHILNAFILFLAILSLAIVEYWCWDFVRHEPLAPILPK